MTYNSQQMIYQLYFRFKRFRHKYLIMNVLIIFKEGVLHT